MFSGLTREQLQTASRIRPCFYPLGAYMFLGLILCNLVGDPAAVSEEASPGWGCKAGRLAGVCILNLKGLNPQARKPQPYNAIIHPMPQKINLSPGQAFTSKSEIRIAEPEDSFSDDSPRWLDQPPGQRVAGIQHGLSAFFTYHWHCMWASAPQYCCQSARVAG